MTSHDGRPHHAEQGRPNDAPRRQLARVTRVVIVEDERLLAEMLTEVIAGEADMLVVGVGDTVAAATALASRQPDVVIMDFRLPDGTGAQATRSIKARWATARVVMLSAMNDDETLMESIQAGADGYLTKDSAIDDVVSAVRRAHAGEILLPPSVIGEIARRVAEARASLLEQPRVERLTPRELAILHELANGASTEEMCERLSVTANTLRTHTEHILHKLGVHSKLEAVVFGLRHGLLDIPHEHRAR